MDGADRRQDGGNAANSSIWARILEVLARANPLALLMAERDPRRTTAFTVGVVALGAKLAKADGRVTTDEVAVFRTVFHVEPEDERRVAQVFNLCRQDTAGWDAYARQLARLFADDPSVLKDVLDALTAIAMADGEFHPAEEAFLTRCAELWGVPDGCRKGDLLPLGAGPVGPVGGAGAHPRRQPRAGARDLPPAGARQPPRRAGREGPAGGDDRARHPPPRRRQQGLGGGEGRAGGRAGLSRAQHPQRMRSMQGCSQPSSCSAQNAAWSTANRISPTRIRVERR